MQIINCIQGSQEWLNARAWCITGTRLKSVMSSRKDTRENLMYELIAEKMAPLLETYQSGAMERWHLVESVVKELYPEFEEVGFIKKYEWLWLSPDGLKKIDGNYTKALEVKWPEPKNTMKYWLEDKIPDEYFWQVIMYFIVIDTLEELNFVICNPDVYDSYFRIKVIKVTRKELEKEIDNAKVALADFYTEWTQMMQKFISLKPITNANT